MKQNILIIDDDKDIREMLINYFTKEGYLIGHASNGEEGLEVLKNNSFSLIILDVMMPKMDGYTMLIKLRELSNIPVMLLTAKDQQIDKIKGFINGCDDYVVKPFDFTELSLRVMAILKRSNNSTSSCENIIRVKDIEINSLAHTVKKDDIEIILTPPKEYEILYTLASNKDRIYSTKILYELLWKDKFMQNDNTVTMHIKNLRNKLKDNLKEGRYIKTVWGGVGYKIEKDT